MTNERETATSTLQQRSDQFAGSVLSGAAQPSVRMVKCVVSGCPNRLVSSETRGIFNRPPKRFFQFPKDPARVKVTEPEPEPSSGSVRVTRC